jgi:hypothetical protein
VGMSRGGPIRGSTLEQSHAHGREIRGSGKSAIGAATPKR